MWLWKIKEIRSNIQWEKNIWNTQIETGLMYENHSLDKNVPLNCGNKKRKKNLKWTHTYIKPHRHTIQTILSM